MEKITLLQVPKLTIGCGCLAQCKLYLSASAFKRAFLVAPPIARKHAEKILAGLPASYIEDSIEAEPSIASFKQILDHARHFEPDVIIGIGGGSALDVAKLVAALWNSAQQIEEVMGINLLRERKTALVCIPTTAGTGSEVSPNAILLDEADKIKKGIISPCLVPDAVFVDAELTLTVPPSVTAATGLDALTHCIETYTNRFAHPVVDIWALEGIRLIASALVEAVQQPASLDAREKMARGSLYGGLCLGPVNTAAVHALSYPLGGWFHIAHGHANAILLPHVMRFNSVEAPSRYADVAVAMGVQRESSDQATAESGVLKLWSLIKATKLEMELSALGIRENDLPRLATAGLGVTRLMKNNPRSMSQQEAEAIYRLAYKGA
jgi:alcohol dehydrogenase class IV